MTKMVGLTKDLVPDAGRLICWRAGVQVCTTQQARVYADRRVAEERELWADKVMIKNLALMACASLLERVEIADGSTYGDLSETAAGVAEALRA